MTARWLVLAVLAVVPSGAFGQGWVREPDAVYARFEKAPRYRAFLPDSVDLSARFPTPGHQGKQGSCTAWAVGYAVRTYYEGQHQGWDVQHAAHQVSPAAIYNQLTEDRSTCTEGTAISDALDLLRTAGAVDMATFPYVPSTCASKPAPQQHATSWRIPGWRRLDMKRLDNIKGELALGHPVVFGLDYSKSLHTLRGDEAYDDTETPRIGGHAMVVVGYSDARRAFKVMNSWGPAWGEGGFGWVSYRAMEKLSDRGFVINLAAPSPRRPSHAPPRPLVLASLQTSIPMTLSALNPQTVSVPIPAQPVLGVLHAPTVTAAIDALPLVPPAPSLQPITKVASVLDVRPQSIHGPPVLAPLPVVPFQHLMAKFPAPPIIKGTQDQLEDVLAGMQCRSVKVTATPDGPRLNGFVGSEADRAALTAITSAMAVEDVVVRPWPQCEALLTFAGALESHDGLAVRIMTLGAEELSEGDSMILEVTTPSFPSYLYAAYLQAGGNVVHLAQATGAGASRHPPRAKVRLGGGGAQPTYRIAPPFGAEMVVVIATASPLFTTSRAETEIERDYLTAFRLAFLEKPRRGMPNRRVSAAVTTLTTRAE